MLNKVKRRAQPSPKRQLHTSLETLLVLMLHPLGYPQSLAGIDRLAFDLTDACVWADQDGSLLHGTALELVVNKLVQVAPVEKKLTSRRQST